MVFPGTPTIDGTFLPTYIMYRQKKYTGMHGRMVFGGSLFFIVVRMIMRHDNFGFNFERSKQAVLVVAFGFRV